MAYTNSSMGGHFPAFLSIGNAFADGLNGFESARSALYALLLAIKPRRIHVPNYICEAVNQAIRKANIEIKIYGWLEFGSPSWPEEIADDECLLVVDYFGLSSDLIRGALKRFPPNQVIVDCSQAYFSSFPESLADIYSPRKFLPVPDGGLVRTQRKLESTECNNEASIAHYQYMLRRCIGEPEETRQDYLRAEERLEEINANEISSFTRDLIFNTDASSIKIKRRLNFEALSELSDFNALPVTLSDQVPLCYPLMVKNGASIREELLSMRIFTPKFWPNIEAMTEFENRLLSETVFLPVDHRYNEDDMVKVKNFVKNMI